MTSPAANPESSPSARLVPRLVVGLGNPGPEYEWTRHNIGFHVVERLAALENSLFQTASKLDGWSGSRAFLWAHLARQDAWLVKPTTFMNRSGDVVAPLARWLQRADPGDPARILVVYDDLDLELGRLRIRPKGGAGGHNGMRSIIERLGTDGFPRLRVGIGRPGTDAARYVLQPFLPAERVEAEISMSESVEAILDWLSHGDLQACMTRFHSRWNQES